MRVITKMDSNNLVVIEEGKRLVGYTGFPTIWCCGRRS